MRAIIFSLIFGLVLTQSQLQFIHRHWVDEDINLVTIEIDKRLANGSDGACSVAAKIFHAITSQGYTLYVISPTGFVPSLRNPMDVDWTEVLVREDEDQTMAEYADQWYEDHRNQDVDP